MQLTIDNGNTTDADGGIQGPEQRYDHRLHNDRTIAAAVSAYEKLLDAGVPAEDARYLLPNAAESKIVITMNVRELLHFFRLRCCNRAQWVIRVLALRMLELARPSAPFIFADAGAPGGRGTCPEGKMTCGNPYPKVTRE